MSNEQSPPPPTVSEVLRQLVEHRELSGEARTRIRAEVRSAVESGNASLRQGLTKRLLNACRQQTGKREPKWLVACGIGGVLAVAAFGIVGRKASVPTPPTRFKCVSVVYADARMASWSKRVLIVREEKDKGSYLKIVAVKTPGKD